MLTTNTCNVPVTLPTREPLHLAGFPVEINRGTLSAPEHRAAVQSGLFKAKAYFHPFPPLVRSERPFEQPQDHKADVCASLGSNCNRAGRRAAATACT